MNGTQAATRVATPVATRVATPVATRAETPAATRPATRAASTAGGPAAVIRRVRPADLSALGDFFAGLSVQSRYLRFFAPVTPGPALLRLLSCDAGTGVATGDAMVAVARGRIVGHGIAADRGA